MAKQQQQWQSGAKLIANERINQKNNNNRYCHYSWQKLNSIFLHGNGACDRRGGMEERGCNGVQHEIAFASFSVLAAVVVVVVALLNSVGNNTFLTPNSIASSSKGFSGRTFPPRERKREGGVRGRFPEFVENRMWAHLGRYLWDTPPLPTGLSV